MSNELATRPKSEMSVGSRGIAITSLEDLWRFAQYVVKSEFCPRSFKTPESVCIAIQHGLELGFTPMQALQSVAVINGVPRVYGSALTALALSSGVLEEFEEWVEGSGDTMVAHCKTRRKGQAKARETTFSVAQAKRAKLWGKSGPWTDHPERMLQMRARGRNFDDNLSDVTRGMAILENDDESRDIRIVESRPLAQPQTEVDPLGAMLDDDAPQSPESDAEPDPTALPLPELPSQPTELLALIDATGKAVEHETRKRDALIRYILGCEAEFDWQASAKTGELQRLAHVLTVIKAEYDKDGKPADKDARLEVVESAMRFVDGELAASIG